MGAEAARWVLASCFAALFATLGLLRFHSFHNETFDLAFYARMVWGLGRGDTLNPLVGARIWGLHLSWVLFPLGWLSRVLPLVPLLLIVQALSVALAAVPLGRVAARRLPWRVAPWLAMALYLLHPTIASIATYEFHPSSLALLPLALALDAFDQDRVPDGLLWLAVAVSTREDVALVTALVGVSLALDPRHRRTGLALLAVSLAYFALYLFVIAPRYLPREGSLQLHYGHLGASPRAILRSIVTHPIASLAPLATPVKIRYVPRLLLTTGMLSLLAPRWLLPALAPIGINLLSQFPTAVQVHSHYATLTVPFFVTAAIEGLARVNASRPRASVALACVALAGALHMQHRAGVLPLLGRRFDPAAFKSHPFQREIDAALAEIPPTATVVAPDPMLAHLCARDRFHRYPQPARRIEYRILSTEFRARFEGTEEAFRNIEERTTRDALYWDRYGVLAVHGPFIVERAGVSERHHARGRYVEFTPDPRVHAAHADVGPSMAIAGWGLAPGRDARHTRLILLAAPTTRWPFDVGFQVGWGPMAPHLDREDPAHIWSFLPFDGVFMAVFVRPGEVARTEVELPATAQELLRDGLWFGARRIDSSRLDAASAHWTRLRE